MRIFPSTCILLIGACIFTPALAERPAAEPTEGLVAHWTFNEGQGTVVRDVSGNGLDGTIHGARYVPHGDGYALEFDGTGAYVDFGDNPALDPGEEFSLEMWLKPSDEPEGMGIRVIMGRRLSDFAFGFHPIRNACYFFVARANAMSVLDSNPGVWNHIVGVFQDGELRFYLNGKESWYRSRSGIKDENRTREEEPFLIGASTPGEPNPEAAGQSFKGKIAEAAVYDRALTAEEIQNRFAESNLFGQPGLRGAYVPPSDLIAVDVDTQPLGDLPSGAMLIARLAGGGVVLSEERVEDVHSRLVYSVEFSAAELEPGLYTIEAEIRDDEEAIIGRASSQELTVKEANRFPEETAYGNRLNNLVTECINASGPDAEKDSFKFSREREGWTFVRARLHLPEGSEVELIRRNTDGSEAPLISAKAGDTPPAWAGAEDVWEAMHLLPAGDYELVVQRDGEARVEELVVRGVPELIFNAIGPAPHTRDADQRDIDYYSARGLRYSTSVVNEPRKSVRPENQPFVEAWQEAGRKVYINAPLPHPVPQWPDLVMDGTGILEFWMGNNYWVEGLDGMILDEMHWRTQYAEAYAEATRAFHEKTGAEVSAYAGQIHQYPAWSPFLEAIAETGGTIHWERYYSDNATTLEAWRAIGVRGARNMAMWQEVMGGMDPDMVPRTLMLIGLMDLPQRLSLDQWPQADWNVYLDLRFHAIANDPAFDGIGGISLWKSNFTEEEQLVLIGNLYRHYFIEGHRDLWTETPYQLRHIRNPGFEEELQGWAVTEAEPGSVTVDESQGFTSLRGHWGYPPLVDDVVVLRRSADGPNILQQTITGLEPGRYYSITATVSNFDDMSLRESHPLDIRIENGEIIPGESFTREFTNEIRTSRRYPDRNSAWMTRYRKVFQAERPETLLTISDWISPDDPGGRMGQETMIGFVEVRPYIHPGKNLP